MVGMRLLLPVKILWPYAWWPTSQTICRKTASACAPHNVDRTGLQLVLGLTDAHISTKKVHDKYNMARRMQLGVSTLSSGVLKT